MEESWEDVPVSSDVVSFQREDVREDGEAISAFRADVSEGREVPPKSRAVMNVFSRVVRKVGDVPPM
jgi:hypothetical protein